jgi:hypothetical protein
MDWASFALAPFVYKGMLMFLEVLAVICACAGACLASCCHFKCWKLDELGVLKALGYCTAASVGVTFLSLAFTAVMLQAKWTRALDSEIRGSLLVMSMYALFAALLLCLRVATTFKAFKATTALAEEVITV